MKLLVTHLCLTLWDPIDCSPLGSFVRGILQSRTLECIAFPSPGDLPNPGIEPLSPALQADSWQYVWPEKPFNKVLIIISKVIIPGTFYFLCFNLTWLPGLQVNESVDRNCIRCLIKMYFIMGGSDCVTMAFVSRSLIKFRSDPYSWILISSLLQMKIF